METYFNGPIPYPASFPAPGGGLIFFCALFLYQDKKRVWGVGGKAPHDNSPRHKPVPTGNHFNGPRAPIRPRRIFRWGRFHVNGFRRKTIRELRTQTRPVGKQFANLRHKIAPIGKHFTNPRRTVALIKSPFGNLFHDHAPVEAFNGALFYDHTLIEVFNGT